MGISEVNRMYTLLMVLVREMSASSCHLTPFNSWTVHSMALATSSPSSHT